MRPTYENEKTLKVERETIEACCAKWGVTAVKLPKSYRLDWSLVGPDGSITAWAECKRRYSAKGKYPSFMMSVAKWLEGCRLAEQSGLPFILIVEWDDGIHWVKADKGVWSFGIGGRSDRGDQDDIEPMAYIDIANFKQL